MSDLRLTMLESVEDVRAYATAVKAEKYARIRTVVQRYVREHYPDRYAANPMALPNPMATPNPMAMPNPMKGPERQLHIGDLRTINGKTYRLNENSRWERAYREDETPEDQRQQPPDQQDPRAAGEAPEEPPSEGAPQASEGQAGQQPPAGEGAQIDPASPGSQMIERIKSLGMLEGAWIQTDGEAVVITAASGQQVRVRTVSGDELEALGQEHAAELGESRRVGGGAGEIAGAYRNGELLMRADASAAELSHEMVHAFQDMGLVSQQDVDVFGGREQMAYAYQEWVRDGRNDTKQGIFERIWNFIKAILGDKRAQQEAVMRKLDSGKPVTRAEVDRPLHVDPTDPASGIRADGTVNGASIQFATREWRSWFKGFAADPRMRKTYSDETIQRFGEALELAAGIFGDFSMLPEEQRGSPLRQNSDPLFGHTADSSTICPMQDMYVSVVNALQHRTGRLFKKEERFYLKQMLQRYNLAPSCWYCYGQAARDKAADTLIKAQGVFRNVSQGFRDGSVTKLFGAYDKQVKARKADIKAAEKEIKVATKSGDAKALTAAKAKLKGIHNEIAKSVPSKIKRQMADLFGRAPNSELKSGWEQAWAHWNPNGSKMATVPAYIKKYANSQEARDLWEKDLPRVHDLAMGYEKPKTQLEADTVKALRAITSVSQINLPKGWSSYAGQFKNMNQFFIDKYNKSAGFRFNSQSDFRPWHSIEMAQMLAHLGERQGKGHLYTRQPEALDIFGNTGLKFNMSVGYAHDENGRVMRDDKGTMFDMIGMNREKALEYREKYAQNAGTMLVALNDEDIETALDDDHIDMMIPYHAGSVPKVVDAYQNAKDFSEWQHEDWSNFQATGTAKFLVGPGKWENKKFAEVTRPDGSKVRIYEHQPITREHHGDDRETYLSMCKQMQITPRFAGVALSNGQSVTEHPNYMKMVRDVARYPMKHDVVDINKINWNAANAHEEAYIKKGGKQQEITPHEGVLKAIEEDIRGGALERMKQAGSDFAAAKSGVTTKDWSTVKPAKATDAPGSLWANMPPIEQQMPVGKTLRGKAKRPFAASRVRSMVIRYVKDHYPAYYARYKPAAGQKSLFDQPAAPPDPQHPRAPAGGTTVAGETYAGGEFVPKEKVAGEIAQGQDPAAGETPPSVEKEPWQRTKAEHTAGREALMERFRQLSQQHGGLPQSMEVPEVAEAFRAQMRWGDSDIGHRPQVAQALRAGKPVPAEVLADYPDLVNQGTSATTGETFLDPSGKPYPPHMQALLAKAKARDERMPHAAVTDVTPAGYGPEASPAAATPLTPEEQAKYDEYVQFLANSKMQPKSPEEWVQNYRAVQARRAAAAVQAAQDAQQAAQESAEEEQPELPATVTVAQPDAVAAAAAEPLVADSPRAAAAVVQRKQDEDYEFARASVIGNRGEDLKGSARHKVNAWRGLQQAEEDGTAEQLVTRESLERNEPHSFMALAAHNPVGALVGYLAMKKFPPRPGSGHAFRDSRRSEEEQKKDRQQYVESWQELKQTFYGIAAHEEQFGKMLSKMQDAVADRIRALRGMKPGDRMGGTDPANNTGNLLVGMYKALAARRYGAGKTSVANQLNEFGTFIQKTYPDVSPNELLERTTEHAMQIIEGTSLNKLRGVQKATGTRFNPADMYVNIAEREGGRDLSMQDPNQAVEYMVSKMGMRGLQWGNSVTDEERQHHAIKATEAMVDLMEVLGLEESDASLGGKLGLAIGARGHGTNLAHYEPSTQVINLTRKSGVGSLAHEWGHAFDHFLEGAESDKFMSEQHRYTHFTVDEQGRKWNVPQGATTKSPKQEMPHQAIRAAYREWKAAASDFRNRLEDELDKHVRDGLMSRNRTDYWRSSVEVFARTFERYVQRKLEVSGRKNTYLAGIATHAYRSGGLWPTDEEVDAMTPAFDQIFAAHAQSDLRRAAQQRDKYCKRLASQLQSLKD